MVLPGSLNPNCCLVDITPTSTPTITPTKTPTKTPATTYTATPTCTYTITPTNTPTVSVTASITATCTSTPTNTPTPTITPTYTATQTITPSNTITQSVTSSNTPTVSITSSVTKTPTVTPTNTKTPTNTSSVTPTVTKTQTQTRTTTPTPTPTRVFSIQQVGLAMHTYKLAINENLKRLYIGAYGNNGYTVYNTDTLSVTSGSSGQVTAIGTNITTGKYYIGQSNSYIMIRNGSDNSLITSCLLPIGYAFDIRCNTTTNKTYVSGSQNGNLYVIDNDINSIEKTITGIGARAYQIAINSNTNRIYAGNLIIDENTNTTTTLVLNPSNIVINNNKIYMSIEGFDTLYIANESDPNTSIASITTPSSISYLAVNQNTNRIFACHNQNNTISIIDGNTNLLIDTIYNIGNSPNNIVFDNTYNKLYVSHAGNYYISIVTLLT